jgi:hypothetical protein
MGSNGIGAPAEQGYFTSPINIVVLDSIGRTPPMRLTEGRPEVAIGAVGRCGWRRHTKDLCVGMIQKIHQSPLRIHGNTCAHARHIYRRRTKSTRSSRTRSECPKSWTSLHSRRVTEEISFPCYAHVPIL